DPMSNAMRIAVAATAVLVFAAIAIYVRPSSDTGTSGPIAATSSPTLMPSASAAPASPSTSASPSAPKSSSAPEPGQIPEGPFAVGILEPTHGVQVDVPRGWTFLSHPPGLTQTQFTGLRSRDQQALLSFQLPGGPGGHPCDPIGYYPEADFGPSVDDLADHIVSLKGLDVVAPLPVTLGGYHGKYLEFTVTPDIDCAPGDYYPWQGRVLQGLGEIDRVWILDVDGTRLVVDAQAQLDKTPADLAELQSMVDSIRITAASPRPTP
ncbi:MAG TPA: hypothetical protein VMT36_00870, partial [Candidatus Saccharimonadia bacterium]|nr:hypothetical protein [Candidatus Saccharimonadia bacterium]